MKISVHVCIAVVLLFCAAPSVLRAQVVVSEFMYDLGEGSDTGREWVEIFNAGAAAIDMTSWRLFEAGVNHTIAEFQGGTQLAPNTYAVIADNPAKFLLDNSSYTGLLFDSAFSLSNAGESFGLRDPELIDKDGVSYTSTQGGAGDGMTLHREVSGAATFTARTPTPGAGLLAASVQGSTGSSMQTGNGTTTSTVTPSSASTGSSVPDEPQLFAFAGGNRTTVVGADTVFEGKALSKDGDVLSDGYIQYVWNFGDGTRTEGKSVMHHWAHPGTYVVVLDVGSGKLSATHRVVVTAEAPRLRVSTEGNDVRIENHSVREVDLSFWHVRVQHMHFTLPEHSLLLPESSTVIPHAVSKLPTGEPVLLFPNGTIAATTAMVDTPAPAPTVWKMQSTPLPVVRAVPASRVVQRESPSQKPVYVEDTAPEPAFESTEVFSTSSNVAAAASALPAGWGWLFALVGIIGVGALATIMAHSAREGQEDEGWTIIDNGDKAR